MAELGALEVEAARIDGEIMAANVTPEQVQAEEQQQEQAQASELQALGLAQMGVELVAGLVGRRWPVLVYSPEQKTTAAAVLVPVLVKYDLSPAWLDKYKEEFAAGAFFAGLVIESVRKVREAEAAAAEKAKKDNEQP